MNSVSTLFVSARIQSLYIINIPDEVLYFEIGINN